MGGGTRFTTQAQPAMRTKFVFLPCALLIGMGCSGTSYAQDRAVRDFRTNCATDPTARPDVGPIHTGSLNTDSLCDPDHLNRFWSVDMSGTLRQWEITDGVVGGGDTLLSGVPGTELAYSSVFGSNTFITSDSGRISHFENGAWIDHAVTANPVNLGGANVHLYFMTNENTTLGYFDGVSADSITSAEAHFTIADVAVRADGRAYMFAGPSYYPATSINTYNSGGELIDTYPFEMNMANAYGSFMLGNILYVGFGQLNPVHPHTLLPFTFSGSTVTMGQPIPFAGPASDLASCTMQESPLMTPYTEEIPDLVAFPTPADELVRISLPSGLRSTDIDVRIFDALGRTVPSMPQKEVGEVLLHTAQMTEGVYYLTVLHGPIRRYKARLVVKHD